VIAELGLYGISDLANWRGKNGLFELRHHAAARKGGAKVSPVDARARIVGLCFGKRREILACRETLPELLRAGKRLGVRQLLLARPDRHARTLKTHEDVTRFGALKFGLVLFIVLAGVRLGWLGVRHQILIQVRSQDRFGLQVDLLFYVGPLIQLEPPGFLGQRFDLGHLLGDLPFAGKGACFLLYIVRQQFDKPVELRAGHAFAADHENNLVGGHGSRRNRFRPEQGWFGSRGFWRRSRRRLRGRLRKHSGHHYWPKEGPYEYFVDKMHSFHRTLIVGRRSFTLKFRLMAAAEAPKKPLKLKAVWPDIWALVKPRRAQLGLGLVLIGISRSAGLVLPASTKFLVDDIIGKHKSEMLTPLVLAVLGATTIQALTGFWLTQLLSKSAQRLIADLRASVQAHVGRLSVTYFDANKTGQLVSRIMNDVEGVRNLVGTGLVELLGGFLTAFLSFFMLIRISATLTGMALGIVLAFVFILQRAFRTLRPIFRERGKIQAEVSGRLTESLGGIRVIKGYHAEEREEQVFRSGAQRILDNVLRSLTGVSLLSLSATVLLGLVGALVMFMGGRQILAGQLTLGGFVTFTAFMGFLVAPVFQIVGIGTQLTEAIAGLERTREILNELKEDADPRRIHQIGTIDGYVRFEDVSFSYEPGKEVLHDISFQAAPGSVTALVGSSGSGKSTTIGLIAAFHTPSLGAIFVDGIDLSTVRLSSYRTQLGVVLQETFLFDGTIGENVRFSKPEATEADWMKACRIARVDEFAENFKDRYDTIVGERGVRLSGGQKQRVSIARAILADPRILILDEATSSLDSETESMIQEGLSWLMKGRTTFVIAHRLSTIRRANQILVLESGRIVERGSHAALYAAQGRYYDLYTRQHGVEANLFLAPGEGDTL
jgi:ABC-type multidrug transport system fused ATPase/permease subunit